MLRTAQATRMFLVLIWIKMLAFSLLQFYDAGKTAKKAFAQAYRALEVQQFYVIRIDALKIEEQMRVKIGKKLKNSQPQLKIYWLLLHKCIEKCFWNKYLIGIVGQSFKSTLCCTVRVDNCIVNQKKL